MMKKFAYGFLGLVVLVIAVAIALPFLIPAERIKEELILAVSDATGRTLSLDGDFGVSVFPVLGINATKVSFSNAASSNNPNMATIDRLTVELNVLPLLSGNIKVATFILDTPVVFLEVDEKGGKNWEFSQASSKQAEAESAAASSSDSSGLGIRDLNLGDVKIINGALTYDDRKGGSKYEISAINLAVILNGLDERFKTEGTATWNGEVIELETQLGALRAVLENKATSLKTSIKSSKVSFTYDGALNSTTPLSLKGDTDLDVPSLKQLAQWAGQPIEAKDNTFGPLKIKGTADIQGVSYAFKQASLAFDQISGMGDFSVNLGGKIPSLSGKLEIPLLNINPYLSDEKQAKADTTGATSTEAKSSKAEKWDSSLIDFSGLHAANVNFELTVDKILIQKIKIGKSVVTTNLDNGLLKIGLKELSLYDGKGKGSITVNARSATTTITNSFTLENIKVNPLLTDAADFDKLSGTGLIQFQTTTKGNSQKAMVDALNGKGKILFENGSLNGINLAAMARNVTSAFTDGGEAQKTDFAELSGTFTIKNGLLENKDLKMLNPFVRLSGAGKVDMPPKTLDYRIDPKLVANTKGQGGDDEQGLVVPVLISGSWDDLKFAPDLVGIITNIADPKNIGKALESTGKGSIKILEGGVKGLLGKIK